MEVCLFFFCPMVCGLWSHIFSTEMQICFIILFLGVMEMLPFYGCMKIGRSKRNFIKIEVKCVWPTTVPIKN